MTLSNGDRVRLRQGKDVIRDIVGETGDEGTVTFVSESEVHVRLDEHHHELDEWYNELIWTTDDVWVEDDVHPDEARSVLDFVLAEYLEKIEV